MVVSLPSSDERTPSRLSPRSCKLERPSVVLARVLPVAVKRFGVVGYQVEESDDLVCSRRRGLSGGGTRRWMLSRPVWRVGEGGMSDRSRLSPISPCAFRCNSLPAPLLITPAPDRRLLLPPAPGEIEPGDRGDVNADSRESLLDPRSSGVSSSIEVLDLTREGSTSRRWLARSLDARGLVEGRLSTFSVSDSPGLGSDCLKERGEGVGGGMPGSGL